MNQESESPRPPPEETDNRRVERLTVDAEVALRRTGQHRYRVRVHNASPHGCRIEFIVRPKIEERVWIKFEGLNSIEGKVCWVEGHVAGIEFSPAIHPAVFELLVPRLT